MPWLLRHSGRKVYEEQATDHVAFWALVDQQYACPTQADLARLGAVRDGPMPDVQQPVCRLPLLTIQANHAAVADDPVANAAVADEANASCCCS